MTDTDTTPVTGGSSSTDQAHAGQPAYAQPQVFAQPAPPIYIIQKPPATKKGFGLTSMILGISAVLFSWTTVFAFILLILAFIFGIVSLMKKETPRGFAITGLALGSAAVLLVILFVVVIASLFGAAASVGDFGY